ncbi:FAD-dependent oxidoreductase [Paenibacillus agricola]|uniref:FAD-dependent monooxygenase n=1 Tax=Paenibacillus agricola TaxID=2716264 RepID=A0ABX0J387_9BACL|nr:NAD(P)/FAD-dependent oxidoreductase [Paenibacillus agricola]NHN30832.1 FAD-dependent monooxygenase [Paenibacillus agricola]
MNEKKLEDLNVVIIGGGIGGFATAVALQNKGIQAHVYEQAQRLGEVGAGITIHPSSQHLFEKWGLGEVFYEKARINKTIEFFTPQGELVTNDVEKILPSLKQDKLGLHRASIHRAHLLDLLISPIDPEYIHLDHKFKSLIETDDYVEITFENGAVVRADVVIAANGIHSNIRTIFSNDEPIYSGIHSVRTILGLEATKETAKEDGTVMYRDDRTVILMQPVAGGMHFDILYPSEDSSWVKDTVKEELLSKLTSFDEKLVRLLDTIEYPIVSRALYCRQPIPQWSTNRVTLLGDAAHSMLPTLGQGANSAIADADSIARALSECATVKEALQQYENERRPVTTAIQNESQQYDQLLNK